MGGLAAPAVAVAWLAMAGVFAPARAHAAAPATTTRVAVTITNAAIAFAPSYAPAGKVIFTIRNRTRAARDFEAGARHTGAIAAGGTARLAVTVAAPGERRFASVAKHSPPGSRRLIGALHLFAPCPLPAQTTVNVSMSKATGGFTLSQTRVPCGTVNFVVTDVDTPATSLLVSVDEPPLSAVTSQIDPGGSTTLTVQFAAKGVVHCDAVADDSDGDSVVVGAAVLTLF